MKCSDCRFWKRFPSFQEIKDSGGIIRGSVETFTTQTNGTCRFNPPVKPNIQSEYDLNWPVTLDSDFCGKFESIPQPPHLVNPIQQP
jgi:hypothetical protein